MAGERRLYLERNCRLPESPAHSRRRNREGPASSKGLNSQRGFGPAVEPRRKSRPRSMSLHGSSPCKCQRLSTLRWDRLPPSRPSTKSGARAGGRRLSDRRLHRWLAGTSASAPSSHGAADLLGLNRAHICVRNHKNRAYVDLVERLGTRSVYVLSAGWGLIRSDFLTPQYDITFRGSAQRYKRRRQRDVYLDFCQLQDVGDGPVLFFGGKDYLPLFAKLTADLRAERVVFFNSNTPPQVPGCALVRYETTAKTNWHYGCVCAFLDGRLSFSPGSLR